MTVLESIYVSSIFDVWLYTYFFQAFFERRYKEKWKHYGRMVVAIVVLIVINSRQNLYMNLVGGLLLFFCVARGLFAGKARMLILYEVVYYVVACLAEAIASFLVLTENGRKPEAGDIYSHMENPMNVIFAKMLTYSALIVVMGLLRKKRLGDVSHHLRRIFVLPITSLILTIGIQRAMNGDNTVVIFGTVLLLFANVFTFYYVEEMVKTQEKNKEYELLNKQSEMKEIYYEKMEEIDVEHRKYVHNLKDYLQTIGGLAAQEKTEDILGLLQEMTAEVESIRETRYTGNSILNALLCEKESIAEKCHIKMQIEPAPYITFSFAQNKDLIVMVGNLIDNAIEAAAQCDKSREIRMYFSREHGNFETIQIDNTYNGIVKREEDRFLTTKSDKDNHGFGIQSVKETAEKYGGMVLMEADEGIFTTILMLSNKYYRE